MTRWPPYQRTAIPARAVRNIPSVFMLRPSICSEKTEPTRPTRRPSPSSARARSTPKALIVSTPETSSTRWAERPAACSIASSERRRVAGWCAATPRTSTGTKAVATSASRSVVEPEDRQQDDDQRAVDDGRRGRAADGLAHLGGVVDPREDLADPPHLEEVQGQAQDVAGVAGDQGQVDLAADVGHQVLPEQAEEGPEDQDQDHADAQGVEQAALGADQDVVDEVLDEVGGGDAQDRHQQGAEEGLGQDGLVVAEQAQEPAPRPDRCPGRRAGGGPLPGHDHEQVAGPAPAELVAGQLLGPRGPGRPR